MKPGFSYLNKFLGRIIWKVYPSNVDTTYFRAIPGSYFEGLGITSPTRQDSLDFFRDVEPIDWQEAVFQEGIIQSHRLSVSGGDHYQFRL